MRMDYEWESRVKKLLIFGVVGLTAATFYGALWHKSEAIEEDVRARVSKEIAATTQPDISVGVDGRHVTLTGVVHDVDRERHLLNVARNTYGALGPIDGLTYAAQNGFVSAVKTAEGIRLAGTVPDDAALTRLVDAAKLATDGTVEDELEIAGAAGPWHAEAGFGLEQLGLMSSGTMTAGAGAYVLSGTAKDDPTAIRTALANRDSWHGQVFAPDKSADFNAQIARLESDLNDTKATVSDQTGTIVDLRGQVSALEGERETQRLSFLGDLKTKDDALAEHQATIDRLNAEMETLQTNASLNASSSDDLAEKLSAAEASIIGLTATLGDRDATIADLKADLDLTQDNLSAEKSNSVGISEQLATAQKRVSVQETELAALTVRADKRNALLAEREAALSDYQQRLKALSAEQAEQLDKAKDLAAKLTEAQAALDSERTFFATKRDAKDALISERDAIIETLKADLETATTTASEAEDLRKALSSKTADLDAALIRITEAEAQVKQESAAASANRAMIDDLNNQLSNRENQVAALAAEMSARDATIASLRSAPANALQIDQCTERTDSVIEGSRINFVTASAEISADSIPLLERLTGIAIACSGSGAVLEVGGHTDNRGEEDNNQTLSEARAAAVVSFMATRGVPEDGLSAVGYGEAKPIADNETEEGRAENRRISFAWQAR